LFSSLYVDILVNTAADFTTIRYISCYWIGPCLTFPYLVIIGMTILQFLSLALESDAMIEVWVTEYGIIYVFLLIYPFALQFTILLGLVYEEGFWGTVAPRHARGLAEHCSGSLLSSFGFSSLLCGYFSSLKWGRLYWSFLNMSPSLPTFDMKSRLLGSRFYTWYMH